MKRSVFVRIASALLCVVGISIAPWSIAATDQEIYALGMDAIHADGDLQASGQDLLRAIAKDSGPDKDAATIIAVHANVAVQALESANQLTYVYLSMKLPADKTFALDLLRKQLDASIQVIDITKVGVEAYLPRLGTEPVKAAGGKVRDAVARSRDKLDAVRKSLPAR